MMMSISSISFEEYNERVVDNFTTAPPIDTDNELPISRLPWETFEKLCVLLSYKIWGHSRFYLSRGHNQQGIDIYCMNTEGSEPQIVFIQCKKSEKQISKAKIEKAVEKFLKGNFNIPRSRFIICTSNDLGHDGPAIELEQVKKLRAHNIEFEIWDRQIIEHKLRSHPQVVYQIFDGNRDTYWTEKFCGPLSLAQIVKKYLPINKSQNYPVKNFINRFIYTNETDKPINHQFLLNTKRYELNSLIKNQEVKKIFLLSDAGSGKTSAIKQLAFILSSSDSSLLPIFCNLKNYDGDFDNFLNSYCPDWNKYDPSKLIFLFDGLDEISADKILSAVRKLNLLIQDARYNSSTIVISARTNFYNKQFPSLQTFYFQDITHFDIENYAKETLGDKDKDFFKLIAKNNLSPLLYNFFSLVEIVSLFAQNGESNFPNNKSEIYEKIIERKIESNEVHFHMSGKEIEEKNCRFFFNLERVPFTMTLLGKDTISKSEVSRIVPMEEDRTLLKYGVLLSKDFSGQSWDFEHKNYKEFLSARVLSRLSFDEIKQLISFAPNNLKIKPRWINTISFLFSILTKADPKFDLLLNWLISIDPEVILKFESGSISNTIKISILDKIISYYSQKNMLLSNAVRYDDVARFCGDDIEIVKFITQELRNPGQGTRLQNVIYLTRSWSSLYSFRREINSAIKDIIQKDFNHTLHRGAIESYFNFSRLNSDIDFVLQNCPSAHDYHVRPAIYEAIFKEDLNDKYIDFYISGISYERKNDSKIDVFESSYYLTEGLQSCKKSDSLKKSLGFLISYYTNKNNRYPGYRNENLFNETLIESCIHVYKQDPTIFSYLSKLSLLLIRNFDKKVSLITKFVESTNTELHFFQEFCSGKTNFDAIRVLSTIATNTGTDYILTKFEEKKIQKNSVLAYRNSLQRKKEEHQYLYDKLLQKYGHEFKYADSIDYQELQLRQQKCDLEVLKSVQTLLSDVEEIFKELGKENLTFDEIFEWKIQRRDEDPYKNTIVPDLLQRYTRHGSSVSLATIKKRFDNPANWNWWIITNLHHILNNGGIIDNWHKEFIINWCKNELKSCNFNSSVRPNEGGGITYNERENSIQFFWQKLNFNLPDDVMLDMLSYDWSGIQKENEHSKSLADMILDRISDKSLFPDRVLKNLEKGINTSFVLRTHIRLCRELKIYAAGDVLFNEINGNTLDQYEKKRVVDIYIELGGAITDFKDIIKTLDLSFDYSWHILDLLFVEDPNFVLDSIRNHTATLPNEKKLRAAKYYLDYGDTKGINLLLGYFRSTRNELPYFSEGKISLTKFDIDSFITSILDLLLFSFSDQFHRESIFRPYSASIISILNDFALYNDKNFIKTKQALEKFIEVHENKESKVRDLYYWIDKLERDFYLKKEDSFNLEDALNKVAVIFSSTS